MRKGRAMTKGFAADKDSAPFSPVAFRALPIFEIQCMQREQLASSILRPCRRKRYSRWTHVNNLGLDIHALASYHFT